MFLVAWKLLVALSRRLLPGEHPPELYVCHHQSVLQCAVGLAFKCMTLKCAEFMDKYFQGKQALSLMMSAIAWYWWSRKRPPPVSAYRRFSCILFGIWPPFPSYPLPLLNKQTNKKQALAYHPVSVISMTVRATTRTGYIVTSSNFTKWRPHLGTRYVDIFQLFSGPWSALFPQYFENLSVENMASVKDFTRFYTWNRWSWVCFRSRIFQTWH